MPISDDYRRLRALSDRGAILPARITATGIRRDLREVLARVEYAGLRVEVLRGGRPLAAILPLSHLRQLEEYERTGIRYFREHMAAVAELDRLRMVRD